MKYIKRFNENLNEYDVENISKIKGEEIVKIVSNRTLDIITKDNIYFICCGGGETVEYDGISDFNSEVVVNVKFTQYSIELELNNGEVLYICDPTNGEGLEVSIKNPHL